MITLRRVCAEAQEGKRSSAQKAAPKRKRPTAEAAGREKEDNESSFKIRP
jgi:hypothetical protein